MGLAGAKICGMMGLCVKAGKREVRCDVAKGRRRQRGVNPGSRSDQSARERRGAGGRGRKKGTQVIRLNHVGVGRQNRVSSFLDGV